MAAEETSLGGMIPFPPPSSPKFTFIDLFAGIGGFRLAMQACGGKCVFSSEWDPYAQQSYFNNYGVMPFGDITLEETKEKIPEHFDVLCAGFPCQAFSHAGLKKGFEDTRGTLFHEIATILKSHMPKVAFLENVKGLISHDKGKTLQIILRTITSAGYSCNIPIEAIWDESPNSLKEYAKKMVLCSKDFGVCQNRQRIYIVLWRNDLKIDSFKYPEPTHTETHVRDILEKEPEARYTISDRMWLGHQNRKARNEANGKGFGYSLVTPDSNYTGTISARYWKDGSEILLAQEGKNPRTLTPREAARLQGYPDSFIIHPSRHQAYKQFGNSVSVPVVTAVSKKIVEELLHV